MGPGQAFARISVSAEARAAWGLSELTGRIVEISGFGASAVLTAAFGLVVEAQAKGEAAAWVTLAESCFFPPDAAELGVDLEVLAVVRVRDLRAAGRAADHLVRSASFGLVVVDAAPCLERERLAAPLLTRLLGLAQKHDTAVVLLTEKPPQSASTSSLVSLRVEARRRLQGERGEVEVVVLKDKRRGPGASHVEVCRGPAGLR
jgi:recombination protein RecA